MSRNSSKGAKEELKLKYKVCKRWKQGKVTRKEYRYCLHVWDRKSEKIIPVALIVLVPLWWDFWLVRAQRTAEGNEINFFIL